MYCIKCGLTGWDIIVEFIARLAPPPTPLKQESPEPERVPVSRCNIHVHVMFAVSYRLIIMDCLFVCCLRGLEDLQPDPIVFDGLRGDTFGGQLDRSARRAAIIHSHAKRCFDGSTSGFGGRRLFGQLRSALAATARARIGKVLV